MSSETVHKPSFNFLWEIAYQYAINSSMTLHRAEQFAKDYAHFHDGMWLYEVTRPVEFVAIAAGLDYHYHH